jgi:hypothetical protein
MVEKRRDVDSGAVFKRFQSKDFAQAFAAHFRDLTVVDILGPTFSNKGAVSSKYYGIYRGEDANGLVSNCVADTEGRMRALTVRSTGEVVPEAVWASFDTYSDARMFATTGHPMGGV